MDECFYLSESGNTFLATGATAGPWDPRFQHGGPPAALITSAIEQRYGDDGHAVVRLSFEIHRPIPVGRVRTRVETLRGGSRVQLVAAHLSTADGQELMSCLAWRFPQAQVPLLDQVSPPRGGPGDNGADGRPYTTPPFFEIPHNHGYHKAMEWRFTEGSWRGLGPAFVWMRMRNVLIDGIEPSPTQRLVVAADSVSGASAALDPAVHAFPNVDLTVRLLREPVGEWIGFDARSRYSSSGTGWALADIYDDRGLAGTSAQSLLVAERTTRRLNDEEH
ncbi:MAG: thioesterase family protein [Pseudonocardia sp.]